MHNLVLSPIDIDTLVNRIANEVQGRLLNKVEPVVVENKFITREETAKRLGLSLPTLCEYSKIGLIPSYRIGSRVRYKSNEIEECLQKVHAVKGRRA